LHKKKRMKGGLVLLCLLAIGLLSYTTQETIQSPFKVLAFYDQYNGDLAHVSFLNESIPWFELQATRHGFLFEATKDWTKMNDYYLLNFDVVIFLDTRAVHQTNREAFERYIKRGGGWLGFHFSAFMYSHIDSWPWYHDEFLGSGHFRGNTWRPTSAVLRVETKQHPVTLAFPDTFVSAPNEWYAWDEDLSSNPNITILCSIDNSSFPLGTGPKPHEIWHSGYYPVVWTNKNHHMVYFNMGHNDMNYDIDNRQLSSTFSSPTQNQMLINALKWVGNKEKSSSKEEAWYKVNEHKTSAASRTINPPFFSVLLFTTLFSN